MIKVIFFDFDGTISDTKEIAYESMVRVLNEFDYEFNKRKLRKLMGSKIHEILNELGLEVKNLEVVRKFFYKFFIKAVLNNGIQSCVSLEPLWKLSKEYPLIVVSNTETTFLKMSVDILKLEKLFKGIYGAEKFGEKDEMLKKLFKKMNIKPNEAIYVGDRFSDINYAKKAKCISVAIHNKCSWSDLKTIEKEKPDHIIKDFEELEKLVEKLNRV